jgi:hypothetical protein
VFRLSCKTFTRPWFELLTLVFVCFTAVASVCSAGDGEHLSVRVLDARSGKPITDIPLLLGVPVENKNVNRLRDKTDSQGTVTFHVDDPIPDSFWLIFGPDIVLCHGITFSTEQVLKTGVIADNKCKGPKLGFNGSPKSGELVVFVKRLSLWELIKREL